LIQGIYKSGLVLDTSKYCDTEFFCDLTKALDCVNHDILAAKLEHYGIQDTTLNWFKSYLIDRKQREKLMSMKTKLITPLGKL
jgi:hypothetical protein